MYYISHFIRRQEKKATDKFFEEFQGQKPKNKCYKTELLRQNKTKLIKQKEKNKQSQLYTAIQIYMCNIFTSLQCHKFITHINVR